MKIIDTHTHVISPATGSYPHNPIGGHQSEWSQTRPVDIAGLLRAMNEACIDQAVVVQASTVYGHDNRYVTDAVQSHPERLVGVYSIDALAADAVAQIQHWQQQGLSGFRLFTTGSTMPGQADWLGAEASYPAWAYAEANQIPVCLQMTMQGLPALRTLLQRFPASKVLLDHCARPELADGSPYAAAQALFDMAHFPGVHLKLTNRTLAAAAMGQSTPAAFLQRLLQVYGADRIAWGSNFPAAEGSLPALLQIAREALDGLTQADRALIFGGTAKRLYPTLASGASA